MKHEGEEEMGWRRGEEGLRYRDAKRLDNGGRKSPHVDRFTSFLG